MTNNQRAEIINALPYKLPYGLKRDDDIIMGCIGDPQYCRYYVIDIISGEITKTGATVTEKDVDHELIACLNYMIGRLQNIAREIS